MAGRWFEVRIRPPYFRDWETIKYLSHPLRHPEGETAEEVKTKWATMYTASTQIEVRITEAA
jgi:hypothetical protein